MAFSSFDKIHTIRSSYNAVKSWSGIVLPKKPPNTYLRRRNAIQGFRCLNTTSQVNVSTKDTPTSSNGKENLSIKNEKVRDRLGFHALSQSNNWIGKQIQSLSKKYSALFGLENLRNAEKSLVGAQVSYFETKARREAKQIHVNELNVKHRKAKITKPILSELTTSMQEVENAIKEETDALSRLSLAISETKERGEFLENQIKYSSYILFALSTALVLGSLSILIKRRSNSSHEENKEFSHEQNQEENEIKTKLRELENTIITLTRHQNEMRNQIQETNTTERKMEIPNSHLMETEKNIQKRNPTHNQTLHSNGNDEVIVGFQTHVESLCSNLNKQQNDFLEGIQKFQLETSKSFENLYSIEYQLSKLSQNQSNLTKKIKEFCEKLGEYVNMI